MMIQNKWSIINFDTSLIVISFRNTLSDRRKNKIETQFLFDYTFRLPIVGQTYYKEMTSIRHNITLFVLLIATQRLNKAWVAITYQPYCVLPLKQMNSKSIEHTFYYIYILLRQTGKRVYEAVTLHRSLLAKLRKWRKNFVCYLHELT